MPKPKIHVPRRIRQKKKKRGRPELVAKKETRVGKPSRRQVIRSLEGAFIMEGTVEEWRDHVSQRTNPVDPFS